VGASVFPELHRGKDQDWFVQMLRISVVLACLVSSIVAAPWGGLSAAPRIEITIIPYQATETDAKKNAFDEFRYLIVDMLRNKALDIHAKVLEKVQPEHVAHFKNLKPSGPRKELTNASVAEITSYNEEFGQLAVLGGVVIGGTPFMKFMSNIYVGSEFGDFSEEHFRVSYLYEPGNVAALENAHMFYFLYALLKDAFRTKLPKTVILKLFEEAGLAMQELDTHTQEKYAPMIDKLFQTLR
jgi:hypothetical protein